MNKKAFLENKYVYALLICLLVIINVLAIILVRDFIGFNVLNASGGAIHQIRLIQRTPTVWWAAAFGQLGINPMPGPQFANLLSGDIVQKNLLFSCFDSDDTEVYAINYSSLDLETASVRAAPPEWVDEYFGIPTYSMESANRTFLNYTNFSLGTQQLINVPTVHTYVFNSPGSTQFPTGILNISGMVGFVVMHINATIFGYNPDYPSQYQILLAVPNRTTQGNELRYYFYPDPFDVCIFGQAGINGTILGYVFDNVTGALLENVTVYIYGKNYTTNTSGWYNITVLEGLHNFVAYREGYDLYWDIVNITGGNITYYNFSMNKSSGNIEGYVKNVSGQFLDNVTVSIFGQTYITNETGYYRFDDIYRGTHNIVAVRIQYENFVDNVTIIAGNTTQYNITMTRLEPPPDFGFIEGWVTDLGDNLLPNISVSANGQIYVTNESGYYFLTVIAGTHNLVATGSGYDVYYVNVTVNASETTQHNITMIETVPAPGNGTIQGYVSNISSDFLANVTVSAAGVSYITNNTGFYRLIVPNGIHNIVAVRLGYDVYVANVTIDIGNVTEHNITMNKSEPVFEYGYVEGYVRNSNGILLDNVTVSAGGEQHITNGTGRYRLRILEGIHNLVAIRVDYDNYVATINITANNVTYHNITMNVTEIPQVGPGVDVGPGTGTGPGVGPGQAPPVPIIEQPVEIVPYELSIRRIVKKIRKGTFIEVPVTISNHREAAMRVHYSIVGDVKDLIQLDHTDAVVRTAHSDTVTLTIFGREVGVFNGSLVFSGDVDDSIPIDILVYEKEKLPIEALLIRLKPLKRKVRSGALFKYIIDMQNLLREETYNVYLSYIVTNVKTNESYNIGEDRVTIKTFLSVLKSFTVPFEWDIGEYKLELKAEYLGFVSRFSTTFFVVQSWWLYTLLGIPVWILLIILTFLMLILLILLWIRKKKKEKERYKVKVDMATLPKMGDRAAFVGNIAETNIRTYFDIDQFQVHTIVAGTTGSGKTIAAQDIIEEALLKGAGVIVFDPTAQWTGFLRKLKDPKMFSFYPKFGMKKSEARAFNGNLRQVLNARELIDIKKYMIPGEVNVFSVNRLQPEEMDVLVANVVRQVFRANLPESKTLKLMIVFDEVHRLLPKFGGSGQGFIQIERACREFRKWGVGLLLISQGLTDFIGEIKANINTQIQMRTRNETDLARLKEEYGDDVMKSIVKATVGTGMVENAAYNNGKPYFVNFRPILHEVKRLSDEELDNYNKYNAIIDDLEYQLEQLRELKQDTFDLELELKLAKDKVKSGNFNMVDIYLEGLTPRLKEVWKKLGKTPKKKQVRFVSESELMEDFNKAKKDREKPQNEEKKPKSEESKDQELKPPQQEDSASSLGEDVDSLIKDTQNSIKQGDRNKALATYAKIQQLYKTLPQEIKKRIFQQCIMVQKQIAGM